MKVCGDMCAPSFDQSGIYKRDDAQRQRRAWYSHIFRAKAVKVYGIPKEAVFVLKNKRKWLISPVFFFASNYINASHHIAIEYRVRPGFRQKGHMAKCSSV